MKHLNKFNKYKIGDYVKINHPAQIDQRAILDLNKYNL